MRRYLLVIALAIASLFVTAPAGRADEPAYSSWQGQGQGPGQGGDMQQLLKQLRAMIDKADRDKAANPRFLQDLRSLADSYDSPWRARLFYDDFRSGRFPTNPAWTVSAGYWEVNQQSSYPGLVSKVAVPQGGYQGNNQNGVLGILGQLLQKPGTQRPPQQGDRYAAISTAVAIPNAFEVRIELASLQQGAWFDFGPYQGYNADTGYFLTYRGSGPNGLVLSSASRYGGTRQIAASNGPLRLEDGRGHVLDWKRDRAGSMTVALDGRVVITATDGSIRKSFDGLLVTNSGGTLKLHTVGIFGSR